MDFAVKDDAEAPWRLEFSGMLRERAGSEGDFSGKRQTSPRSGCKNHSSAEASLTGTASCEKKITYLETASLISIPNIPPSLLWGVWVFLPGKCCGIFRGDRQGQCDPGTELLLGNPRLLPDLGRGCCWGFAVRFASGFLRSRCGFGFGSVTDLPAQALAKHQLSPLPAACLLGEVTACAGSSP